MCAYISFGVLLRVHQDLVNNGCGNFLVSQQEACGWTALCIAE